MPSPVPAPAIYNTLSLKGLTARALIAKGLHKNQIDVAGLQETREQRTGFSSFEGWWILSASSTAEGIGGAQIWINPSNPKLAWDRRSLSILHAAPQCLIITARVNGIEIAVVSAHAPPTVSPLPVLQAWWDELAAAIRVIPRRCCLVMCVDANARFHQIGAQPETLQSAPACRNADFLLDFTHQVGGDLAAQFDSCGNRLFSWTSPSGHRSLLDYVLFAKEWSSAACTLLTPDLQDLHSGRDHDPVLLEIDATIQAKTSARPFHVECTALATPQGVQVARQALASVPQVPWEVDSTLHVDIIHRHLRDCMKSLPPAPPRARNPAHSQETVQLVLCKRHMQRCLATMKKRLNRHYLWVAFQTWRQPDSIGERESAALRRTVAATTRRAQMYQEARQALTQSMLKDKAAFARRGFHQARDAGPREFAFKLRAVLRTGRRFRAPPLVPVLRAEGEDQIGREAVLDSFARHFASPERATATDLWNLVKSRGGERPVQCLEGEKLPSLVQLAGAFAALKPGKAPGVSQLPSELFRIDPCQSALLFWPVMLKATVRDPFPMQWRGGLAVAVPKPGKASDVPQGYRSVLLLEPSAKAVQKAYRPLIHEAFLETRTPAHYGGVAKAPLTLPSACAKAHLLHLDSDRSNGGAVFIDCAAAYYSVAREVLTATPTQLNSDEWVNSRAAVFFDANEDRQAFVSALRSHSLPALLQGRPELAALLRGQLADTWFSGRAEAPTAMRAESGTVPGSPVADLLFGLVFQRFLWKLDACLERLGCSAFAGVVGDDLPTPSLPTWADDVSVLFETPSAAAIEPALRAIMTTVTTELRVQGLSANLGTKIP